MPAEHPDHVHPHPSADHEHVLRARVTATWLRDLVAAGEEPGLFEGVCTCGLQAIVELTATR